MMQDVAMVRHVTALGCPKADCDCRTIGRYRNRITPLPNADKRCILRWAVDVDDLEVIQVRVERMHVRAIRSDAPLLQRS